MFKFLIKNHILTIAFFLAVFLILGQLPFSEFVIGQTASIPVTLTWSTDSYTPLSYPGKALPSRGSLIEVAANVEAEGFNPRELIYDWFVNEVVQKEGSGLGKQSFKLDTRSSVAQKFLIKVKIKNQQGDLLTQSNYLLIKLQQPEVVLLPKKLSVGPAKSNPYQFSSNQNVEFLAYPYFFNIDRTTQLDYNWHVSGQPTLESDGEMPNLFILKIGQIGQAINQKLGVWAVNKKNPSQRAQAKIEIILNP